MCGINGIISSKIQGDVLKTSINKMNDALAHRGPDNAGSFFTQNVILGHRRLSIIDLNEESNQPFKSTDGKFVIVFNGEIYNYKELKLELQRSSIGSNHLPYFFQTQSDTEVLLAAYIRWGEKCLDFLNGLFAFAIYDLEKNETFIARDKLGVKPLYYHYSDDVFIFSSEVRAIIKSGIKAFKLNENSLAEYIQYQTVHTPNTIVQGIRMLKAGHYILVKNGEAKIKEYWKASDYIKSKNDYSKEYINQNIHELLYNSISRRLNSDVPFGAFLSGGIDSSIVVGYMSKILNQPVDTFTVTFDESEFSEAKYAKLVSEKFNTNHHEIKLKPEDFLKIIPEALDNMDHPSGDGPNSYIVSKATKEAGITMALSGIGGDELFIGYSNFTRMKKFSESFIIKALPGILKKSGGLLYKTARPSVATVKLNDLLALENNSIEDIYPYSRSLFSEKELSNLIHHKTSYEKLKSHYKTFKSDTNSILSTISCLEIESYLQNVLLRDTDQMSMAVALEVREPFLDHHLVEFTLGLTDAQKLPTTPKKVLIDAVGNLLPPEIINRPKMGFTFPWQHWLKNELREFCETNLLSLDKRLLLNEGVCNELWQRFLKGDKLITWSRIWHLVVLNYWIEKNLS
ncbi:MAG: asparagine synthase (glutamine-hydrolyzing) [Bacteroidia bacterium]